MALAIIAAVLLVIAGVREPMIEALIVLVIVGVALYLLNQYVPMAPPIKTVLNVVVVLFLILWLLRAFGIFHGGPRL